MEHKFLFTLKKDTVCLCSSALNLYSNAFRLGTSLLLEYILEIVMDCPCQVLHPHNVSQVGPESRNGLKGSIQGSLYEYHKEIDVDFYIKEIFT